MAAARVQAQPDVLPPLRPGVGEHAGQAAVAGDVDGVLVATAVESDVGDGACDVVLIGLAGAQLDPGVCIMSRRLP